MLPDGNGKSAMFCCRYDVLIVGWYVPIGKLVARKTDTETAQPLMLSLLL